MSVAPRAALRAAEDDLWAKALARLRRVEAWRFWVNVTLVVGGGAVAGLGRVLAAPWSEICTIGGVAAVLVGGTVIAFTDRRRSDLIDEAKAALAQAQVFLDERVDLEARLGAGDQLGERRTYLLTAQRAMVQTAGTVIARDGGDIVGAIQSVMDASVHSLAGAIGFEPGEAWTFSIFRRVGAADGERMERIVARWADRSLEGEAPRSWRINDGYTGAAWGRNGEVIIADTHDPNARAEFPLEPEQTRPYDEERYRSVAAIPVRQPATQAIWGVVTATTDRAGRFKREPENPGALPVETVRVIGRTLALLVAAMPEKRAAGL